MASGVEKLDGTNEPDPTDARIEALTVSRTRRSPLSSLTIR
jgi:hypothetical protein